MQDHDIIELFFARNESAIAEVRKKYGSYCHSIALHITKDDADAEECVSDTYLKAWETIPPKRPENLAVYLGKITRNLAVGHFRREKAEKRGRGEIPLVLDELSECIGEESVERTFDMRVLSAEISAFLGELPQDVRVVFVLRYWYAKSIKEIALQTGRTEASVSMLLSRLRKKLGKRLSERGFLD